MNRTHTKTISLRSAGGLVLTLNGLWSSLLVVRKQFNPTEQQAKMDHNSQWEISCIKCKSLML